jgi:hypothetical protein
MRTVILDSGAFIAAERHSQRLAAYIGQSGEQGATILIPAAAVAEVWREPPRHRSAVLLDNVDSVIEMSLGRAKAIGALMGVSRSTQIVDASVARIAYEARPSLVLTSDPDDIAALVRALDGTASIDELSPRADVAVKSI